MKLENESVKKEIARAIAGGHSQTEVAKALAVSQSTVSRLVGKEDVKALIERESLRLLEAVPQAVENLKALVNEMPNIPKKEIKRLELSLKATIKMLESAGMLNTPSPSPTLVNIFNAQNMVVSPVVDKILGAMGVQSVDVPQDVNYEEEED